MSPASATSPVTAFAPASIGNIGVGFDVLGHSIAGPRDLATVRRIDAPDVVIESIEGDVAGVERIPLQAEANTAGRALMALREALRLPFGFALSLRKGIALGSGMGGSACSSVAAVVAANALLETPLDRHALYPFALQGESVCSGNPSGDNIGPMLLGGVVLATPDRIVRLDAPERLHVVLVRPEQELETRRSRAVLADPYALPQVVAHCRHLALFLTGLAQNDDALIHAGLVDTLVEPRRAALIPGFADVKRAALDYGALGASISGGGPSVFAWFSSRVDAEIAMEPMRDAFEDVGISAQAWLSPVNGPRAEVLP